MDDENYQYGSVGGHESEENYGNIDNDGDVDLENIEKYYGEEEADGMLKWPWDWNWITLISIFGVASICTFAALAVKTGMFVTNSNSDTVISLDDDYVSSSSSLSFSLFREGYSVPNYFTYAGDPQLTYKAFSGHNAIIEPHATMNLQMYTSSSEAVDFQFYVCPSGDSPPSSSCQSGYKLYSGEYTSVVVECSPHDEYNITVYEYETSSSSSSRFLSRLRTYSGTAICIYVRREIQSLTSSHLEQTMDAMYVLWSTPEEEGQQIYGSDYHDSSYFAGAHDFNAAWQDADHFHEGLGFLPQHIKLTNLFEASIQTVDPSFSLPYWDYTLEVTQGRTIFESYMFTNKTFGSIFKPADETWGFTYTNDSVVDGAIQDGRWAYAQAEEAVYSNLENSFGYMRGPWNTNPSPYISRFPTSSLSLPSCENFFDFFSSETDMIDFLHESPYSIHGSVHGGVGGIFGCDQLKPFLDNGMISSVDVLSQICRSWSTITKELYRSNYLMPSSSCTTTSSLMTISDIQCGYECVEENFENMPAKMDELIAHMETSASSEETWVEWRDFVCTGNGYLLFAGDHLESASPSDPSFWPVHGSLERAYHAAKMADVFGEYTWPTDAEADYLCDKNSCYESEYGTTGYHTECCYGHYEQSQMFDFVNGDRNSGYGLTNKEALDNTDPTSSSYAMTYVYDDIEWDHCDEDFDALFQHLSNNRKR